MIELHYWPTPNSHKITMFLEEAGVDYAIKTIDIGAGEQFRPDFLAISPNNRMPAIVDTAPQGGGAPLSVFESGAILVYLAEKTGKFLPTETRARVATLEWLFWQMAGLGPMAGQNNHFANYAPEKLSYAIDRYRNETNRLYGVLDTRLGKTGAFLAGADYSIADMASYPWVKLYERLGQDIAEFPNVKRWLDAIGARPATARAYAQGDAERYKGAIITEESRKVLFGQTARSVAGPAGRA